MTDTENQSASNAVDISPNQDGGVLKEIKKEGTGSEGPHTGDKVTVHYVGTLTDGSKFDSSRDRGDKFEFTLGKGQVIKAWDIGVATMKRGELCVLTAKSEYAYGEQGSPPKIPPGATLIFEVELFDWKGEDLSPENDESIMRSTLKSGEGYTTPNDDAKVEVHLVGKYEGKVFEERDVSFNIGEGAEHGIVDGVDVALKKFKKGETSLLTLKSSQAYGSAGNPEKSIPPGATVHFEVTLKEFEKVKESWEMDLPEKLEQGEVVKQKGTAFFQAGKLGPALRCYKRVVDYLASDEDATGENGDKRKKLLLAAYLNLAAVQLKTGEEMLVLENCTKAIEIDANSVKGYFRRGQASLAMHDYEEAVADFKKAVELDPNNKAAKNQILVAQNKIKQQKDKDKKLYAGMFEKFSKIDAKKEGVDVNGAGDKAGEENSTEPPTETTEASS